MRKFVLALAVAAASVLIAPAAANAAPPTVPTNVTARAGTNQATVSWGPATDQQGRSITYIATSTPGSRACVTTQNTCDVTGLSNGQAYTFKVTASVRFNSGDVSGTENAVSEASAPVTPRVDTAAPVLVSHSLAPERVSSLGGNVTLELRITDDLSGFAESTSYFGDIRGPSVTFSDSTGKTISSFPDSYRVSGDAYDGTYRYQLYVPPGTPPGRASVSIFPIRDKAGNSGDFLSGGTVLVGSPAAPANVTTTATPERNARVSWDAPEDDGGNVITGYTITEYPSGRTFSTSGTATSYEAQLVEHPADKPLTYSVVAINAAGTSPTATAEPLTIAATAPSQVAKPGVVRGDKKVAITWTAPASSRGADITGYTATASPGGKTCSADAASRTCDITGLDNGTTYTASVTATNSAGTSTPSPDSDSVTPAAAPNKVATPTAVAGPNRATITWAPATANGTPVTGYRVTTSPGGDTCSAGGADTSCTLTGLTNGTAYTFTVEAISDAGLSPASSPSTAVTPAGAPGAPGAPSVTASSGKLTATWPAAAPNGSAITEYTVTASPGGKTCTVGGAARTCDITGLTNGTPYTLTLTATNSVGTSASSSPSTIVTPAAAPDRVSAPTATAGQNSATVTWAAPATNGTPVTGYILTPSQGGQAYTAGPGQTNYVVRGLTAGTPVTFTITATSAAGSSLPSDPSEAVVPTAPPVPPAPPAAPAPPSPPAVPAPVVAKPGQVSKPTAVAGKKSAKVTWKPAAANGSTITSYRVVASNGKTITVRGTVRSVKVSGLKKGKKYTFKVTALNAAGAGKTSAKSASVKVR
jgi:fibronectin type 3 domain-containing protein